MVDVASVGNWAMNIGILLISILFITGFTFAGVKLLILYRRFSQFTCVIWGQDGFGQVTESTDKAGIFIDTKTQNKRLFLRKANVGLDPDNVPYVQRGSKKVIYLLKTGLKNFRYVKPNITANDVALDVGEEDVNWGINAYERQKKVFGQNALLQYLPFIALAFVSIIILILFIYFFKQFGVLAKVAESLRLAAEAWAASQGGTVVLQ